MRKSKRAAAVPKRCRHKVWALEAIDPYGAVYHWCYRCGSFGKQHAAGDRLRWLKPTGMKGKNPYPSKEFDRVMRRRRPQ